MITDLEHQISQLVEKMKQSNAIVFDLENKRKDQLREAFSSTFGGVLEPGDELDVSSSRITFLRPQEGYNYNKEVLSIIFDRGDWRNENATQIDTSFYSTNCNSDFELRRMVLIGKVGEIVLESKAHILEIHNKIMEANRHDINAARKVGYALEGDITKLRAQIEEINKKNVLDQLEGDGIEFELKLKEGKGNRHLPSIEVRNGFVINYVKSIKVLSKTKSGKSANIELTAMDWNNEIKTHNYENVRMNNIEPLVREYSRRIKNA